MIEATPPLSLFERIAKLCQEHDCKSSYPARRLYLGNSEYEELRLSYPGDGLESYLNLPPSLQLYKQGSFQIMGKAVFLLKDIYSHIALA
jgi:hypothetical protein